MDVTDILRRAAHAVVITDEHDEVLALNPAAEKLLDSPRGGIQGRPFHDVAEFRDIFGNRTCTAGCSLHEMVRRGEPIQAFDLDLRQGSGSTVRVGLSVVVVLGPDVDRYRMVYHLLPRRVNGSVTDRHVVRAGESRATVGAENGNEAAAPHLTRRERQILTRLIAGERSREISDSLGIRPNTLRSHTQNILRKLKARSKVEAVSMALRQNLL